MSASEAAAGEAGMSLTVLMIVNSQDRSRDFYHHVLGAEIVRDRDPELARRLRELGCVVIQEQIERGAALGIETYAEMVDDLDDLLARLRRGPV